VAHFKVANVTVKNRTTLDDYCNLVNLDFGQQPFYFECQVLSPQLR